MLLHYIQVAVSELRRNKRHSFINIGGLALGLAACLLIFLFIRDERSYDRWLPNAERIAKVETTYHYQGRDPIEIGTSPGAAKASLENDFSSDIERVVRIFVRGVTVRAGDQQLNEDIAYVDPDFFDVFDLPAAHGDLQEMLGDNTAILLSEAMAAKYFGDAPAVGQVLTLDNTTDFRVVGVFSELPRNTHLKLDMLARFDPGRWEASPWVEKRWDAANLHTYVLFLSQEAIERVRTGLPAFVARNATTDFPGLTIELGLVPLLDIHLYDHRTGGFTDGGDINTVITFTGVAVLILLLACVNFVNLSTAQAMQRARQVAIRKVVGATRRQLIVQFLGEAAVTALAALVLALALTELAIGPMNRFLDKELSANILADPSVLAVVAGLVFVVGAVGGSYPALYLSRFRPARVLRSSHASAEGSSLVRNALVVLQFAISIGLVASTIVISSQNRYARDLDLGYLVADRVVIGGVGSLSNDGERAATLKRQISALPQVVGASLSSDAPPLGGNNNTIVTQTSHAGEGSFLVETLTVDYDFFKVYGVRPLAGRVFSAEFSSDVRHVQSDSTTRSQAIVVNETFLAKLGIDSPEAAIGMTLRDQAGHEREANAVQTTIVGVVPDLHLRSIHFSITPRLYYVDADNGSGNGNSFYALSIEVEPGTMKDARTGIEAVWSRLAPDMTIRVEFVDQQTVAMYDAIERRGEMFAVFSFFAVLIACLGLFGLASLSAQRRTKEIGVRKVLGASVMGIVRLMLWQFSKPVLLSNVIAWPVAWMMMNRWLATFEYHVELTDPALMLRAFGGASAIAVVIAWVTVAGHAAKVARANPVHALRSG